MRTYIGIHMVCGSSRIPKYLTADDHVNILCTLCISTSQVHLVDGIDSFKPFWVLGSLNSDSTWRSPVTRQRIDFSKLGEKTAFEFTPHTYNMVVVHCPRQLQIKIGYNYTKVHLL